MLVTHAFELSYPALLAMRPPGPLEIALIASMIFFLPLYFLPTIIASVRRSDNVTAILLINIFLGFTLVGWIVALVLALSKKDENAHTGKTLVLPGNTGESDSYCFHCGEKLQANMKYCPNCGNKNENR